jgi:predicted kinase
MKLIITRGIQGSGKSTWARQFVKDNPNYIRINNDDMRVSFFSRTYNKKDNKNIALLRKAMLDSAVGIGLNIVVDNCNLRNADVEFYSNYAKEKGYEFEIKSFLHVPVEECIRRDALRKEKVGENIILRFYNSYLAENGLAEIKKEDLNIRITGDQFGYLKYTKRITGIPSAIICDLDGTLANGDHRSPYDTSKCENDSVFDPVLHLLNGMIGYFGSNIRIIFITGREDIYRQETLNFLAKKCGFSYEDKMHNLIDPRSNFILYMRKEGDRRKDTEVKKEIFFSEVENKYNVFFVLEDRSRVVDMWRKEVGLPCFQVNDGNF